MALVPIEAIPRGNAKEDIVRTRLDFISHDKLSLSAHTVGVSDANGLVINVAKKAKRDTRMQVRHARPAAVSFGRATCHTASYETVP